MRGPVEIPVVEKLAADYNIAAKPSEVVAAVAFTVRSRRPAECRLLSFQASEYSLQFDLWRDLQPQHGLW